jgi:hypothetical protein
MKSNGCRPHFGLGGSPVLVANCEAVFLTLSCKHRGLQTFLKSLRQKGQGPRKIRRPNFGRCTPRRCDGARAMVPEPRPPRARRPLAAQWPPGTPTRLAGAFFSLEATTPAGTRKASQWLSYESGGACSDSVEPRQGQARVVRLRVRLLACVGAMPQHGRPVKAGAAVGGSAS